ncbi:MAG: NADAR family protein [Bacteroidales bacterium]|nr:NADAR family protein [Bacteroidales bacterium]
MPVTFTGVHEPNGWLGSMSPYPITYKGREWRTAEALFQALRFTDPDIRAAIQAATSPMTAKWIAKGKQDRMTVPQRGKRDIANMKRVLKLKVAQHPDLTAALLATGDEEIVEDCTRRAGGSGMFWGAALRDGAWVGQNVLGKLWMEVRAELRQRAG